MLQADLAWQRPRLGPVGAQPRPVGSGPVLPDLCRLRADQEGPDRLRKRQPMRLVPLKDDRTQDIDSLNAEFTQDYLADKRNPRWVAKPTVAYLWARTVVCKNCRATVPLLKTRWLCKKEGWPQARPSDDAAQLPEVQALTATRRGGRASSRMNWKVPAVCRRNPVGLKLREIEQAAMATFLPLAADRPQCKDARLDAADRTLSSRQDRTGEGAGALGAGQLLA